MDPNKTLKRIGEHIRAANDAGGAWNALWEDAFKGMEELFQWLKQGGKAPTVPNHTYISLGNGGPVSYSLLCHAHGATFIRYEFSSITGQMEESHKYGCPAV